MDFIEHWLHVSPDNGSGATEALFAIVGIALVFLIIFRRQIVGFVRQTADHWKKRR